MDADSWPVSPSSRLSTVGVTLSDVGTEVGSGGATESPQAAESMAATTNDPSALLLSMSEPPLGGVPAGDGIAHALKMRRGSVERE